MKGGDVQLKVHVWDAVKRFVNVMNLSLRDFGGRLEPAVKLSGTFADSYSPQRRNDHTGQAFADSFHFKK